jgi:hypothetical protein
MNIPPLIFMISQMFTFTSISKNFILKNFYKQNIKSCIKFFSFLNNKKMSDDYVEIPKVKGADLDNNKLDIFRSFAASIIAQFSGKSADDILGLLEAPKIPEHGDIAIAIPRLRIKGNPIEIAKEWAEKVMMIYFYFNIYSNQQASIFTNLIFKKWLI